MMMHRSRRAFALVAVTLLALMGVALGLATGMATGVSAEPQETQSQQPAAGAEKSRSLVGARPPALTAGRSAQDGRAAARQQAGWFDKTWAWVLAQQEKANRQIVGAIKDLKAQGSMTAAWALIVVSFIYGVLHAAGPGHGKAVISSYVLANERTVKRGIALSFLAAFFQALSAITIIAVLVIFMRATSFQIKGVEQWITTLSWGLIAALGAWLLYTQIKILWQAWHASRADTETPSAHHGHSHAHDHGDHHHHHHGHDHHDHHHHECGAGCGHAHMPDARELETDFSWRKGIMIAASVGVRPCTGAILVLIFAVTNGLLWAGIAATFAMALGTAITVSILAAAAVGSRTFITRLAGGDSPWGWRIERLAGVTGSFLVFALGATFFAASLAPTSPF